MIQKFTLSALAIIGLATLAGLWQSTVSADRPAPVLKGLHVAGTYGHWSHGTG